MVSFRYATAYYFNRNLNFKTPTKINIVTRLGAGVLGIVLLIVDMVYGHWLFLHYLAAYQVLY